MNTTTHPNDSALSAQLAGESRQNLLAIYSDMHKDAYGFRPSGTSSMNAFTYMSTEELISDMEYFGKLIDADLAKEAVAEAKAIADFEERIGWYIGIGAPDRVTALRWELESQGDVKRENGSYDIGYYCYCMGLPYSFEITIRESIGA